MPSFLLYGFGVQGLWFGVSELFSEARASRLLALASLVDATALAPRATELMAFAQLQGQALRRGLRLSLPGFRESSRREFRV